MTLELSPLAGRVAPESLLTNIPKLISDYYSEIPNPKVIEERVCFGTSGHRGCSFNRTFNERHILAIAQAICLYRTMQKIDGPLYLGIDTHALAECAWMSALEVLTANGVTVILSDQDNYTPTPVISHAILKYNFKRKSGFADGIVVTPSHNPPQEGGIKYNPPNGGPADEEVTSWIEKKANELLEKDLREIKRIPFESALKASTTKRENIRDAYIDDLKNVIDMDVLKGSSIHFAVDPLGGAGVHYWKRIAERYEINLSVLNEKVDPTFSFMTVDWDGKIRMDPSSQYAMHRLIELKNKYEVAFACDTDHDRHGIVTKSAGLLPSNHFLSVAIYYLFTQRSQWPATCEVGKTLVSSQMIDRVASSLQRKVYEVPVGFKWFVDGLYKGKLGFVGEESAGASFLRKNGGVWTTDKDGIIMCLLAAEMTVKLGRDPGEIYKELTRKFGTPFYKRVDAHATREEKEKLKKLSPDKILQKELAGEKITSIISHAPGNGAAIGGIKVSTQNGWFAARPSGTEDLYKIYAESFVSESHLDLLLKEAEEIVSKTIQ